MNRIFICYTLFVLLGLGLKLDVQAQQAAKDSVIIVFSEQTRMVIYGADKAEISKLSRYDLNKLLRDVLAKLDSVAPAGVSREWVDGNDYLKSDSVPRRQERKQGRPPKDGDVQTGFDSWPFEGKKVKVTAKVSDEKGYMEIVDDSVTFKPGRRWVRRSPRQGIDLRLGLNAYGKKMMEGYNPEDMDLHPGASRYVSVGLVRSIPMVRGPKSNLFMDIGLDISWYNLMFEGDNVIRKDGGEVVFVPLTGAGSQELGLRKNKLVAPHMNLSAMPTLSFAGSVMSHISAGAYAGYRIGGYQVTQVKGEKRKRYGGDYYMQDIRYGVSLELGFRCFPDLFVNYDLNSLFEEGRGPQVRMVSFGIRI